MCAHNVTPRTPTTGSHSDDLVPLARLSHATLAHLRAGANVTPPIHADGDCYTICTQFSNVNNRADPRTRLTSTPYTRYTPPGRNPAHNHTIAPHDWDISVITSETPTSAHPFDHANLSHLNESVHKVLNTSIQDAIPVTPNAAPRAMNINNT